MILETAQIRVTPGAEGPFEAAVRMARPLFLAARGCQGFELHRVIEEPGLYRLLVRWETLEDHTIHFRGSSAFPQWRALASPHFASPPDVTHSAEVSLDRPADS